MRLNRVQLRRALVGLRYHTNPRLKQFVARVTSDGLTYLGRDALLDLYAAVRTLERRRVSGVFLEAGCALGGSALTIAFAKNPLRSLVVYDVFDAIPPPSPRDGADAHGRYQEIRSGKAGGLAGGTYYGYQADLYQTVQRTFQVYGLDPSRHNVHFVKGRYEDTLSISEPVALAHVDCDWYDSVTTCLERIVPKLVPGGMLVIDDYDHWSGCRRGVDDYFRKSNGLFLFERRSRLHIVRR